MAETDTIPDDRSDLKFLLDLVRELHQRIPNSDDLSLERRDQIDLTVLLDSLREFDPALYREIFAQYQTGTGGVIDRLARQERIDVREALGLVSAIGTRLNNKWPSEADTAVIVPVLGRIGELPSERHFTVRASGWIMVPQNAEIAFDIAQVVLHLNEIVEHTNTSNLRPNERALTEIERAQLIAVLETALNMLKSPMVEKGFLSEMKHMLKKAAEKVIENQVEILLGSASSGAVVAIGVLLSHL